ncbi:MAG: endolytic transglycosylase MltG [Minisyncoccia bacterium]
MYVSYAYIPSVLNTASADFPIATDITVSEGMNHTDIAELLEEKSVVRSALYLNFVLSEAFTNDFVQAGTYRFDTPLTTHEVAEILTKGTHTTPLLKITFPEGFSVKDMTEYLPASFSNIDTAYSNTLEGYLFPDTYFISSDLSFESLIELMQTTFDKKMESIAPQLKESTFTEEEVVTLASIVEREAKDAASKKMVAGILENRLSIDMPLQVDAAFMYLLHKKSNELTQDDLKIDSPYNTYIHTGLPPTPIANPGMESIRAVLEPTPSKYLYYLTGEDGTFYYAETFEEHKANKERYLR